MACGIESELCRRSESARLRFNAGDWSAVCASGASRIPLDSLGRCSRAAVKKEGTSVSVECHDSCHWCPTLGMCVLWCARLSITQWPFRFARVSGGPAPQRMQKLDHWIGSYPATEEEYLETKAWVANPVCFTDWKPPWSDRYNHPKLPEGYLKAVRRRNEEFFRNQGNVKVTWEQEEQSSMA